MKKQKLTTKTAKNNGIKADVSYQFLPDSELVSFAKQFSDNFKLFSVGDYFSDNKKYHIKYLKELTEHGRKLKTIARIANTSEFIELDKKGLKNKIYTADWVFFIILWCVAMRQVKDAIEADRMTVDYYFGESVFNGEEKKTKKNIFSGCLKLFGKSPTELNVRRTVRLAQMLGQKL